MYRLLLTSILLVGCSTQTLQAPPERSKYTPELYGNPDVPYVQDLVLYRDYINTQIYFAKKRAGLNETAVGKQVIVTTNEPKFRPRDVNNQTLLLEDALEYSRSLREYHRQYVKAVEQPK